MPTKPAVRFRRQSAIRFIKTSKNISEYRICDVPDVDLSKLGSFEVCGMKIEIIDPVKDYVEMMQNIFDFEALKKLFKNGFTMRFDAMNAVTGPYAIRIFEDILGAAKGSVVHARPLPDFGGLHPDPNLVYAKELGLTLWLRLKPPTLRLLTTATATAI